MKQIETDVRTIIAQTFGIAPDSFSLDDPITGLAADSIQLFELLVAFESWYKQQVDYAELANIETVNDIINYISVRV